MKTRIEVFNGVGYLTLVPEVLKELNWKDNTEVELDVSMAWPGTMTVSLAGPVLRPEPSKRFKNGA